MYDPTTKHLDGTASDADPAQPPHCAGAGRQILRNRWPSPLIGAVEMYDPQSNTWTPLAPMPTPRSGIASGTLRARIQVLGGETSTQPGGTFQENEEYDPATNTWQAVGAAAHPAARLLWSGAERPLVRPRRRHARRAIYLRRQRGVLLPAGEAAGGDRSRGSGRRFLSAAAWRPGAWSLCSGQRWRMRRLSFPIPLAQFPV